MKNISGKKFCRILKIKGWELKRVKGSHYIYKKADNITRISVPVHSNKMLKVGLQKHLMKIAKISEKEL